MICSAQGGIATPTGSPYIAAMYFRRVVRKNPETGKPAGYYRLVESYRNENDRVCHRTLLTVGFIDFPVEKLNTIQLILNDRYKCKTTLFEEEDKIALQWADEYWRQLVAGRKIDVTEKIIEKKKRMIDSDTMRHKDVREIGSEWMCFQTLEQLRIKEFLEMKSWDESKVQLALTQIISRAVYPFSEYRTSRWIRDNSAVCEITGYDIKKVTKDKLYKSALDLYGIKDSLESHLSRRTNELFDLEDKILLYDLTNTYFEGRKVKSKLAAFGRSKEKRSDCKLVVLALVINPEGFIKYSHVFKGNMSDSKSLAEIIDQMREKTSSDKRAIVVMDAGIATEENCALIEAKGFDYVCVHPARMKEYEVDSSRPVTEIMTQNQQKVSLQRITTAHHTDFMVRVQSQGKELKEESMQSQFEVRFLKEIEKIHAALSKKGGIKKTDKVNQRIGRVMQKYPSMNKYYKVGVQEEDGIATKVEAVKKEEYPTHKERLGVYFIRTNLKTKEERTLWMIYNVIREIESVFRCLKTDLDLRPIYHKNDDATMAHLHLGLLAYWLVNTIRYQLKAKGIKHSWPEILRITNTQKIITTTGKNTFDSVIEIRRCSTPDEKVNEIYKALGYKNYPFVRRKSVVPKCELKKNKTQAQRGIDGS